MKTKKQLLSILLSLAMVLGMMPGMSLTAFADGTPAYSGGTGTEADPYLISTADDWKALATAVNGGTNYSGNYFKQTANLDMSGAGNLEPVGTLTASFAGNYDGCGFAISGAKIEGVSSTVSGQKYMVAGAFGVLEGGGSVTNLRVKNSNITANTTEYSQAYAGGIAAIVENYSVTDCCVMDSKIKAYATGRAAFCGGIVGFAQSGTSETTTFKRCASENNTITTDATNKQVGYGGGFVGAIINQSGLTFTDCYSAKNTISSSNRTMNGAFCGGHQLYGNATLTNGFVYGCTVTTGENGIASLFGYESDSTKYSVSATNTYYYDTQSLPVNASATSATADEMKSLKSSLGDAFFQGDDYPVLQHSIRIGVTAEDRVYGEDAEEPSVTGNSSDGTVTFQYKTKDAEDSTYSETVPTDVGEYTVKVTVKETDHFKGGEATANFTITKANASVTTAPKAKTLTYNKEAQSLVTVGEADGGAINYALGVDDVNAPSAGYTADIPSKTDAGTYYVWYKVVGDENHNDSEPACIKVTIAPNKTDLNKAIEDANEYYTSIKDDTNYSAIASDLKTAIDAAKNVTDKNDATALEVSEALKDISVAKAEASRKVAEAKEAAAKAAQEAAENAKKAAESDAAKAAAAQKAAEVAQRAAEDAKAKAEADKKTAEEAKAKAEDAQKAAEEAQKAAEERAAEAEKNALAPLDQTVLAKTKGAKKKVTVRWKAVSGAKGYQIVVAKNKKGTKKAKTYTVKGASKVKKVVKKLKKGKYYVKVRAYKTYKGNTVYGKFSKVKRVKVR